MLNKFYVNDMVLSELVVIKDRERRDNVPDLGKPTALRAKINLPVQALYREIQQRIKIMFYNLTIFFTVVTFPACISTIYTPLRRAEPLREILLAPFIRLISGSSCTFSPSALRI